MRNRQGTPIWYELMTHHPDSAQTFYGRVIGWTSSGSMPMGDAGDDIFLQNDDTAIGAMMDAPEQNSQLNWNFAFTVDDIYAAAMAGGKTDIHECQD